MGAGRAAQHVVTLETVKVLEMTVLSAKGLPASRRLGRLMSLYVRISLDGKQRQTTKCVRSSGPEPEWNEKLFFNLDEDTLARPLDPSRRLITPDDDSSGFLIEIYQGRPLSRKLLGAQILSVMQAIEFSNSGFTYHTLCLRGSEAYINLGLRLTDPVVSMDQDVEMQTGCSPTSRLRSNSCVRRQAVLGMTLDQSGAGVAMSKSPTPQMRGTANGTQLPSSMSVKKAAAVAVASVGLPPPRSPVAPPVAPLSPMRDHVMAMGQSSASYESDNKTAGEGLAKVLSIGNSSRKRVEALPVRPQFRSGSSRVSAEPSGSQKAAYDSSNMPPVRLIKRPGLAFSTKGPPLPKLVVPYRDRVAQSQQNANGACGVGKSPPSAQPSDRCLSESEHAQGESAARVNTPGRIEETQPSARASKSEGPRFSPRNPVANPNYYKPQGGDASLTSSFADYAGGDWSPVGGLSSPGLFLGRERGSARDHNDRWHLPAVLEVEESCLTPTAGRSTPTNFASTLSARETDSTGRASTHASEGAENRTKVENTNAALATAAPAVAAVPTTPREMMSTPPAMMSIPASSPSVGA